jgi:hypothetical protein
LDIYTNNNPVKYTDPSGHRECDDGNYDGFCDNSSSGEGVLVSDEDDDGRDGSGSGDSSNNSSSHHNDPLQIGSSGLFGKLEGSTCRNFNLALNILNNPSATKMEKLVVDIIFPSLQVTIW